MQKLHDQAVHQFVSTLFQYGLNNSEVFLAVELVMFMTYQHEFCFFACSGSKSASASYFGRVGEELTVKHLGLGTQSVTLLDQIVDLLASLQHTLDSLVEHNLGLVQLLLDLQDVVGLVWVLAPSSAST